MFDWQNEPAPPVADAPLAELIEELVRDLGSDACLVTWHQTGHPTRIVAREGRCRAGTDVQQVMVAAADNICANGDARAIRWASDGDVDPADALLLTKLNLSGGAIVIAALFSQCGRSGHVTARETATRLLPMLRAFFGMWADRESALARVRGLTAAIDTSDVGVLLVDHRGRVLVANAAAEAVLADEDGLRRGGELLASGRLADTMRLQATIEHVIHGSDDAGAVPVIALQRRTRRPLLIAIASARSVLRDDQEAAAIIHVFDPDRDLALLMAPVCKSYALSPVEARLATLIAGGSTLLAAAGAMRIQEQTARSYLKLVFQKTDTKRQAELTWLLLASAVRLSPDCRVAFL